MAINGSEVSGFHSNVISGKKRSFKLYFAAVFDRPFQDIRTWQGTTLGNERTASGTSSGAVLRFDASGNPVVHVRVGISYVSVDNARANLAAENPNWDFAGVRQRASVTLEYANSDFAIAQFALALGDQAKHALYQNRAQNWKNLFHEATGLIQPRNADGSWAHEFQPGSVSDMAQPFVEASAEQTVWMVSFNLGLIDKMGGKARATARLDRFFTTLDSGMRSEMAYMGNEPSEGIPWVYDFAGAPARTQKVVRRIQDELFTARPSGLPGNDDAGSLSSWYVFSALGLYPAIPGVAGFAVGSPTFPKATIHLENGKTIQIMGERAAPENCYVQTLTLNGRPWLGRARNHWPERGRPVGMSAARNADH